MMAVGKGQGSLLSHSLTCSIGSSSGHRGEYWPSSSRMGGVGGNISCPAILQMRSGAFESFALPMLISHPAPFRLVSKLCHVADSVWPVVDELTRGQSRCPFCRVETGNRM